MDEMPRHGHKREDNADGKNNDYQVTCTDHKQYLKEPWLPKQGTRKARGNLMLSIRLSILEVSFPVSAYSLPGREQPALGCFLCW